jgi:hypothetical protein
MNEITDYNAALADAAQWLARRDELAAQAAAIPAQIETPEQAQTAAALQSEIKHHVKDLSTRRLELTRQIDALKKSLMDQEREMAAPIAEPLEGIKKGLTNYQTRQAIEAQREADRRAQEALDAEEARARAAMEREELFGGPVETAQPEPAPEQAAPTTRVEKLKGVRTVKRWSHTVIAPLKVPRDFCTPDDARIRAHCKYCDQMEIEPKIDGVRFECRMCVE